MCASPQRALTWRGEIFDLRTSFRREFGLKLAEKGKARFSGVHTSGFEFFSSPKAMISSQSHLSFEVPKGLIY
jgi:hypothetical protein